MELDSEYLRGWIGREEVRAELLTPALAERFNATFDRTSGTRNGDVAPLLIHLCLTTSPAQTLVLDSDGHAARGGFLPPVPLPRRMWAGGGFTFHDDIRIGETVTRRSRIRDVTVKEGRTGTLCFVIVEHEFESDGRHVISERHDIVYRGPDAPGSAAHMPPPVPHGAHRRVITPSTTLLFRYSALTFNAHRIHYDAPYVREVEGYRGLIVHGPLQATMLVQFAAEVRGGCPVRFDYRNLLPLFDENDFTLNAADESDGMRLWTSRVDGPAAMEARAHW